LYSEKARPEGLLAKKSVGGESTDAWRTGAERGAASPEEKLVLGELTFSCSLAQLFVKVF
jgi:hypothetical protein